MYRSSIYLLYCPVFLTHPDYSSVTSFCGEVVRHVWCDANPCQKLIFCKWEWLCKYWLWLYREFPNLQNLSGDPCAVTKLATGDGMRLRLFPILRGLSPNIRQFSSEAPRASSILTFINRFTTRKAIQRAWAYFLWVPAIIFINDQVVSISPVNGISMRPVVCHPGRLV